MRASYSVVTPGRFPASMSARTTQLAQRLFTDAEFAGHPGDNAPALTGLLDGLLDHADGPFPHLRRMPLR
jgi:hypothetical protein